MEPPRGDTPEFSWMPDNHHLVVAREARQNDPFHLWIPAHLLAGVVRPKS
jgi:hypothetical protein